MLKLDFIFVQYYYYINSLLKNVFHKHNENRNENVIDLNIRTKTMDNILKTNREQKM